MKQSQNHLTNEIKLLQNNPVVQKMIDLTPQLWFNPHRQSIQSLENSPFTKENIYEANELWQRFTPFLQTKFPPVKNAQPPPIESPVKQIKAMETELNERFQVNINNLYLKCDHDLPIAGSIKARGGFYEILSFAEKLAFENGLITKEDSYEKFASHAVREFFSQYTIGVGSTGNLGLSIGIMGAALGFNTEIYMSAGAKQWKKDLLREKGATVHEFSGDFSEAVTVGRKRTEENPQGYFVDDEDSEDLFIGYSTAAIHLQQQLAKREIIVDADHPLFLYLPCGVGGSPGGITFGVKHLLGDHVHCFFVEPTNCPSLLLGLVSGRGENISVQDVGIDQLTEADGLAVGRPSELATRLNEQLISGIYTIEDERLFELLALLQDTEGIFVEPSAAAGLLGPANVLASTYIQEQQLNLDHITHIVWSTGGALVPQQERDSFYKRGKQSM